MSKKILAVFFLLIILAAGGHSAFWFFKTSKLEKELSKYSNSEDSFASFNKFEISGFPLQQNVTIHNLKINLPKSIAQGSDLIFQKVTLSSSIFGDIFDATISENVILNNGARSDVEFDQPPVATMRINSDGLSRLTYRDKGYRIFGPDKNLLTRSGPNNIEFTVTTNESGQIISRIKATSTSTESFDIVNFYKNNYEGKIIDSIKTGKIQIGMDEPESTAKQEEGDASQDQDMKEMAKFNNSISPEKLNEEFERKMIESANAGLNVDGDENAEAEVAEEAVATNDAGVDGGSNAQQVAAVAQNEVPAKADSAPPLKAPGKVASNTTQSKAMAKKTKVAANVTKATTLDEVPVENELAANDVPSQQEVADDSTLAETVDIGEEIAADDNDTIATMGTLNDGDEAKIAVNTNGVSKDEATQDNSGKEVVSKELADLENNMAKNEPVKNNITIDVEYILTPIESNSAASVTDPTKIVQIAVNYNKSYRINKFEITNDMFSININGQLERPQDDTAISGFLTLKIDKVDGFVEFVKSSFKEIANKNDAKINSFDPSYNSGLMKNAYSKFLGVISKKLSEIMSEIAAKNQLSQDETKVFDIRREKNSDIVINETPIREILGKF